MMKQTEPNKIWIMNFEEVYGEQSPSKVYRDFCRHLFCVKPGDLYISRVSIPRDFIRYVSTLKGIPDDGTWILELNESAHHYYLCDSIAASNTAIKTIKKLPRGKFRLKPFYESKNVNGISAYLGIPVQGMDKKTVESGLVEDYNDKLYFKMLSHNLSITTVPGFCVKSRDKKRIDAVIHAICAGTSGKAFMKKIRLNGESGNLKGEKNVLLREMENWLTDYEGDIIVEEYLDLVEVCGSLAVLSDSGCFFAGINSQIIDDCVWQGCTIPLKNERFSEEIRRKSMKYAHTLFASGGRGTLNIDWGIARTENGEMKLYALESNFRYNGFEYVLDTVRSCFRGNLRNKHIVYYNSYPLPENIKDFSTLLKKAGYAYVDNSPVLVRRGMSDKGAVFTACPVQNKTGLVIVGNSPEYLSRAKEAIQKAIA